MRSEFVNISGKKRIGIMGGTFDPIHNGHIKLAENSFKKLNLDKVIFVPTGQPNFKRNKFVTEKEYRLEMTMLGINSNMDFLLSSIEVERKGITYTYDTIETIKFFADEDAEIFFILGTDSIFEIESWYKSKELLSMCSFIIVNRGGFSKEDTKNKAIELEKKHNTRFYFLDMEDIFISSTEIRRKVEDGETIENLVPNEVDIYIKKNYLYQKKYIHELIGKNVGQFMSKKRFQHTLNVVEEGMRLANFYGASKEKVFLATVLHDVAKEFDKIQMIKSAEKYFLDIDDIIEYYPQIAHGFVGAEIARDCFGISDEEILSAIMHHTTGKPNMTLLEKIVFIADKIEVSRKPFDSLETMRKLAYDDIDKAIILSIKSTISYTKSKNEDNKIYSLSKKTLEQLLNENEEV